MKDLERRARGYAEEVIINSDGMLRPSHEAACIDGYLTGAKSVIAEVRERLKSLKVYDDSHSSLIRKIRIADLENILSEIEK